MLISFNGHKEKDIRFSQVNKSSQIVKEYGLATMSYMILPANLTQGKMYNIKLPAYLDFP